MRPVIMANTYSQVYLQVVFAVKGRANLVKESFREELQKYITGIVHNRDQMLYAIFCMPDHTHILLSIKPNITIADLVRDIKSLSSAFINGKKWLPGKFSWQEGYGVFPYGQSQVPAVVQYILNQQQHYQKRTFKEEYLDFLEKFEIQYDQKFLFEWIE